MDFEKLLSIYCRGNYTTVILLIKATIVLFSVHTTFAFTMSFLTEVLSSAQEYDIQQLVEKLPEVSSITDVYKDDVNKYLDSVYVRFEEQRKNTAQLQQSKQLNADLKQLIQIADEHTKRDLATSTLNLTNIKADLQKTCAAYEVASQLLTVHQALHKAASLGSEKCYFEAMELLINTHSGLEAIPEEERTKALDKMIIMAEDAKRSLYSEVEAAVLKNIVVDVDNSQKMFLKVSKQDTSATEKLLLVCEMYSNYIEPLNQVVDFLWNSVFVPIVDKGASIAIEDDAEFYVLTVDIDGTKSNTTYIDTFENIEKALDFLYEHLNFPLQKCKSSLSYMGSDLQQNLSELLIKNCLENTIPSKIEELEKFKDVIQRTEMLHEKLVKSEIFTEEFLALVEYVKNIDTLFINKKCQEYTAEALILMKKDLHDMVEVGEPHDENNPLGLSENMFPKCAVSKSCIAILGLVEKLLQQCLSTSNLQPERIIYTAQKIFNTYKTVVPEYHKKLLETIPQQVALFHNNCLYIAHKLSQWNEEYKTKLPSVHLVGSSLFVDQPLVLRTVGTDTLSSCVKQQIDQIESIMGDSGIDALQTAEELPPSIEKAIRQCLRQQELLKTVWQKVLSYDIYNKAIGSIMNSLCIHLTNAVLKLEDISSKLDEQLIEVFKVVVTRGPKLFTDPKEICLFVKNWNKFNELIFVLNASLVDIDDRWSNGKGPLALQFQAEEIKRLIRALFQNTSRRAQVLSKICT